MGLYVMDTFIAGTVNVLALDGRDVVVRLPALEGDHPAGIYVGKLRCRQQWYAGAPDSAFLYVILQLQGEQFSRPSLGRAFGQSPLMEDWGPRSILLGSHEQPQLLRGVAQEDNKKQDSLFNELWRRVGPNFPLNAGVHLLGKVIGYLSGRTDIKGEK